MDGQILDERNRSSGTYTADSKLAEAHEGQQLHDLEQRHTDNTQREGRHTQSRVRELERQLANGQIPDEIMENLRIVALDSSASISFNATILELAKRLFPEHDFAASPVTFFLMDENEANACHLKGSDPTLIGFTRSLFNPSNECAVKNLDELAFILAHEWTHRSLEKELGAGKNSKGEEGLADGRAVEILFKAGLNPEAALEYSRRTAEFERKQSKLWPTPDREFWKLVDVHPLDTTRISIIQAALTKLERENGSIKRDSTGFSENIYEQIEPGRHHSHLAQYLDRTGYSHSSVKEKLAILAEYVTSNDNWYEARQSDLATEFRQIRINPEISGERLALDRLADRILDLTGKDNSWYASYLYSMISIISPESNHITKPFGRLRAVADAVDAFVNAREPDAIFKTAADFLQTLEAEPAVACNSGTSLLGTLDWPGFKLQKRVGAPLTWHSHLDALRLGKNRDSTKIIKALLILGIDEPCIYRAANPEHLVDAKQEANICLCPNMRHTLRNVVVDVFDGVLARVPERNSFEIKDKNVDTKADVFFKHINSLLNKIESAEDPDAIIAKIQKTSNVMRSAGLHAGQRNSLLGLDYLRSHTELVCDLNRSAISSSDVVQSNLIKYLQEKYPADLQENRELLRELLGFGESGGLLDFRLLIIEVVSQKNLKNPILGYISELPESVVSNEEKLKYFCSNIFPLETGSNLFVDEKHENDISRLEIALIRNRYNQIIRPLAAKTLQDFPGEGDRSWNNLIHAIHINHDWLLTAPRDHKVGNIFVREAGGLLTKKSIPSLAQVHEFLSALNKIHHLEAHVEHELSECLREALRNRPKKWSAKLEIATDQWLTLVKHSILDDLASFEGLNQLVKRIQKSSNVKDRMKAAETLLASKRIIDPNIRETLLHIWSSACTRQLGHDDLSESFQKKLGEVVERVSKGFSAVDRRQALDLLGKKILAQEQASRVLEEGLPKITRSALENTQFFGVATEGMLNMLRKDFHMRMGLVDFLTSPYSVDSALGLVESVLYFTETADQLDSGWEQDEGTEPIDPNAPKVLSPYAELKSRRIYENFWSAPFEARTLFIREFLIPPDIDQTEVDQAFNYILDRTLPSSYQHAEAAKRLLRAYINVIPDYEKHIAMAALLVASEKSASSKHRVGAALATFLETMGPAETKAGQAAQSHPDTPLDIRDDLKRLKTMASEPTRWELYHLIRDNVPEQLRNQIQHVGEVLGSASFFIAVRVTMRDGSPKVLRLLRPSALARAENGFEYLSKMVGELGPDDATFQTLRELIDEAIVTARVETNIRKGIDQNEAAEKIYNAARVSFAGQTFEFKVPHVSAYDDKYMLLDEAPGVHFLDLPEGTAEQFSYKRNVAKAIASFELHRIFSGRYFDKDRHGGNCRVSGNIIFHFDFGALEMSEPTDSELKQLANILFDSLTQAGSEREFTSNYFENLKKLRAEEGSVPHYLSGIQKALLSLGEYRRYLSEQDFKEVIASAAGGLHPTIKQTLQQRAMQAMFGGKTKIPADFLGMFLSPPISIQTNN